MRSRTTQGYACSDGSPGRARRFCAAAVHQAFAPHPPRRELIDDLELVVSELVTNAVDAKCGDARLTVTIEDGTVRVEVEDDAGGVPTPTQARPTDERGRGLAIVAALSTRWGCVQLPRGKRMWAELSAPRPALSPA